MIIVWEFPQHRKHTHKAPQTLSASTKAWAIKVFLSGYECRVTHCVSCLSNVYCLPTWMACISQLAREEPC